MTKKTIYILMLLCGPVQGFAQARIVINDNAFININNGAYLVIDNPNANALSTAGSGGNIISEAETNRIRWNIGSSTGTYVIPFYDNDNAAKIPFSLSVVTAGSAGGSFEFSTYDNASWDNDAYRPSDVGNMNSFIGGPNNSAHVIDRFWIADANTYAVKPSSVLSFTYIDAEWSNAGNAIVEGNLGAQRYNSAAGNWDAYTPLGTVNTVSNTVSGVTVPAADLFRSWTLSEISSPLPIELVSFLGKCEDKNVVLSWTTASEINNSFFTIERSNDGISYNEIGTVPGAGNSSVMNNYSFTDQSAPAGLTYYRLKQTDFDGTAESFDAIAVNGCGGGNDHLNAFNNQQGDIIIQINAAADKVHQVVLMNSLGQQVQTAELKSQAGFNSYSISTSSLTSGVYLLSLSSTESREVFKIHVR
jgi:hypothetical protein